MYGLEPERLQYHLDILSRRRGRNRLPPSITSQPIDPFNRTRQGRHTPLERQTPVHRFLRVPDASDDVVGRLLPEPAPNDAIVLLSKALEKLRVGELEPFRSNGVAPRDPVMVARIDEGPVEIP